MNIREHLMKLVCKLVSAGLCESVDHALLQVHGLTQLMNESLAQIARIKLLEDIFVVQILEDCDRIVELFIDFLLTAAFCAYKTFWNTFLSSKYLKIVIELLSFSSISCSLQPF